MGFIPQIWAAYSIVVLMALLVASGMAAQFHRKKGMAFWLSTAFLLALAALAAYEFAMSANLVLFDLLHVYAFSMFFTTLFAVGLELANALSYGHSTRFIEISALLGFAAVGIFVLPMAYSLLTIIIAIELTAVPTALMIAIGGKRDLEPAVKLLLLSSIAIAVLAFAVSLVFPYDMQLSLSMLTANPAISGSYVVFLSMVLFIAALAIEASLFPFNLWVPDVYQGAPGNITALIAGINKTVAIVALIEILFTVFMVSRPAFIAGIAVLSVLTMFFGNLTAMVQSNVKRMFAYSSISQAGYIMVGIAAASQYGLSSSAFQMAAHMFMIIGAFAIVLWLEERNIKSVEDYKGLAMRNGFAGIALTIIMLSMAGIPPLMGFMGKFLLFSSAISSGLVALAFIGIINSFLSIYYYGRLISAIYDRRYERKLAMDRSVKAVVIVTLAVVIAFGIYPAPLMAITNSVMHSLLAL
ncbi:NADH-quinone oxidoreductase subunit N [Candidatus Marsarchaeota archaeon]|jgi:NADH-quinone oxidoreductase subunit N|nr:NADH-quinone oxidoreductase subunit N [Candidatus Marsarchaeota archaeon]MCL5100063.1 NADH-quinone oxidoreductase subunit N [Candidatus Marsarchaeota archaeon]